MSKLNELKRNHHAGDIHMFKYGINGPPPYKWDNGHQQNEKRCLGLPTTMIQSFILIFFLLMCEFSFVSAQFNSIVRLIGSLTKCISRLLLSVWIGHQFNCFRLYASWLSSILLIICITKCVLFIYSLSLRLLCIVLSNNSSGWVCVRVYVRMRAVALLIINQWKQ